jgi:hypothetical protein
MWSPHVILFLLPSTNSAMASRGNDVVKRSIAGSSRLRRRPSLEKKTLAAGKRQLAREGKEQPAREEASGGRPGKKPAACQLQTYRRGR